jgi:hypothetical protein
MKQSSNEESTSPKSRATWSATKLIEVANRHAALTRFLDAAHTGTADLTVGTRANGRGREQQLSVPRAVAKPVIDHALAEARKLEERFNLEPWAAPKGISKTLQ